MRSRELDSDLYGSLPSGDTLSALQPPATETLQFMADTVVQSKPRSADAASVKLLIFAIEWSCSTYKKLFLVCGEEGSNPYKYIIGMHMYMVNFINLPLSFIIFNDMA